MPKLLTYGYSPQVDIAHMLILFVDIAHKGISPAGGTLPSNPKANSFHVWIFPYWILPKVTLSHEDNTLDVGVLAIEKVPFPGVSRR